MCVCRGEEYKAVATVQKNYTQIGKKILVSFYEVKLKKCEVKLKNSLMFCNF